VQALPPVPQLSVVMPVYNEEQGIAVVVAAWTRMLDRLGISY
jgi:glycosyltransferase involved in cell wall biosynthesis